MIEINDWGFLINFFSLFIPAAIGVLGSFVLYFKRQKDRESNLRSAFLAELEGSEILRMWPDEGRNIPVANFLSLSVYEGNTNRLALLSETETSTLVHYYTQAKRVQDYLNFHTQVTVRSQSSTINSDTKSVTREDTIRWMIDKLELFRQRALLVLRGIDLPSEGDDLRNYPQSVQDIRLLLVDYNLVVCGANNCVFTKRGQEFFEGSLTISNQQRETDSLDRYKSPFRKTWEQRYRYVTKVLADFFD